MCPYRITCRLIRPPSICKFNPNSWIEKHGEGVCVPMGLAGFAGALPLRLLPLARCSVLPMPPALLAAAATVTAGYSAQSVVLLACRAATGGACAASCSVLSDHVRAWWDVSVLLGAAYDPAHTAWIAVWGAAIAVLLAPWLGLLTRWFGKAFIGKAAVNLVIAPFRQRLIPRPAPGSLSRSCCGPPRGSPEDARATEGNGVGSMMVPLAAGEFKPHG